MFISVRDLVLVGSWLAWLTVAQSVWSAEPVEPQRPPNIVFILADDLGYGDLGCYGQARIKTPHIDGLARDGMRFTQFYAGSTVCAPSRCVLMTGRHGGHAFIRGNARLNLRPEDVTVAEVLKKAGYATALMGKWGLGQEDSTGLPTRQGFDEFFGYLDQHHAHNFYPAFLVRNESRVPLKNVVPGTGDFGEGVASVKQQYSPDLILDEALQFIDANKARPFFLYFASTLPHANNEGKAKGMEVPDYGPYRDENWPNPEKGRAAMIGRLDDAVGSLLARLKQHGLEQNTLVVFSSDNGPHAEGGADPDFFNSNGPLRGIKRDLTDGGIRVPFLVKWPGKVKAGSESHFVGSFVDVLATLADVAWVKSVPANDGLSILKELTGQSASQTQHDFLYWEFYERGSSQAVRFGNWKVLRQPLGGEKFEVYDVAADVGETKNLAAERPELVSKARAMMDLAHEPSPHWTVPSPKAKTKTSN